MRLLVQSYANEIEAVLSHEVGVWIWNIVSGDIQWSSAMHAIFEIPRDQFDGAYLTWRKRIHPDDISEVERVTQQCLQTDEFLFLHYRIVTDSGRVKVIKNRARRILDSDGNVVRMIGINVDVTDAVRAKEDRLQLQQRLLQIEKLDSLGTFAGGIAHDFNNFLAAIAGHVEFAMEQGKSAVEMQSVLKRVLGITHRAQCLVSRILTFSKVPKLKAEGVYLGGLFAESFELIEASLPANIEFQLSFGGTDFGVHVDRIQLQQVIVNILNNAVQAIGDRNGHIEITAGLVKASEVSGLTSSQFSQGAIGAAEYAWLEIRDDGPGIAEENLKRIFDPMFTTKAPQQGTGLGLSVSQSIVRAHGGWISATSDGLKGAAFKVLLPFSGETCARAILSRVESVIPLRRSASQVLLVDDDVEVLDLLTEALGARRDLTVTAFSDPLAAQAAFESNPEIWTMVVTDLTMPGVNGLDFCRSIHARRPNLQVILMTGFDRSQVMNQRHPDPRIHVLHKPFRIQALRDLIQKLMTEASELTQTRRPHGPHTA